MIELDPTTAKGARSHIHLSVEFSSSVENLYVEMSCSCSWEVIWKLEQGYLIYIYNKIINNFHKQEFNKQGVVFSPTLFLNSNSSSFVRQSDLAETWELWFTAFEILSGFTNCKIMMSLVLTYHRNDVDFVTESLHELYVELFELVTIGCDEVEACVDPDLWSNFWWYDYEISFWHPIWWQHILSIISKKNYLVSRSAFLFTRVSASRNLSNCSST